jgi:hypothetical protein
MTRGFLRFVRGNTIALLALFVALGGTTYAATALPANSVGTKQLKKNAVINKKIKANAVTGGKVANNSLTGADVNESTLGTVPSATNATNATTATTATNANALGGLAPTAYFKSTDARADGFASSTDIDNFTSAAFTSIASKTFTAPKAGFIFVVGTLSSEDDASFAGIGDMFYRLALDGTSLTNDTFYHELVSDGSTTIRGGSGAASAVVPVSAGSHTVSLQAREVGTGDFILGRDISVLFVPNGSASTTPFGPTSGGNTAQTP